jgi:hypothetical protein
MNTGAWMRGNLTTQGYCMSDAECRALWLGLRFSSGVCLALVGTGLALESAPFFVGLVGIGAVAGFTSRHPFDYVWNRAVRHIARAPALPPNPRRRRDAFKVATAWLAVVAVLFAAGANAAALVTGGLLAAACTTLTVTNLCLPSEVLGRWERLRHREERSSRKAKKFGAMGSTIRATKPRGS